MAQEFVKQEDANRSKDKPLPKAAQITKKDWGKVETFLKNELEQRKLSPFRKNAEVKWKEVDRQISMEPMTKLNRNGAEVDQGWHNVVELGTLAKASEDITAEVARLIFPQTRYYFDAYADIQNELPMDETGAKQKFPKLQERVNGRLRALMMQQHADFGLKKRFKLSVKEALHHGSFVAEVDEDTIEMVFSGTKSKTKKAPVWIPHSMWNCYPDLSPSVVGTNLFYEGTMFVESYAPRYKCERMVKQSEDGWMRSQWKKVAKDEHVIQKDRRTKDVKIVKYWGDINIERPDGDLYYPNHQVILMNGTIVYMAPNKTPYPPIIYAGYERDDVRNPYYTSPVMKQSPMQKLSSTLANKMMDGVELAIEPPIVYDGNDPDFVLNGGPVIAPGAKVSTKGSNKFSTVEIGDPNVALKAMEFCLVEMKEKLSKPGKDVGDRATKAEVVKSAQDQEISIIDFVGSMEEALRSFLYMQHEMNCEHLEQYEFYSSEMLDPDSIFVSRVDLPKCAHFEMVGARGVLGEEERTQKMSVVTAFAASNQLFAPKLDVEAILLQMYADAGVKNPERFLNIDNQPNAAMLQQQLGQAKQLLQKLQEALNQEKAKTAAKLAKIQSDQQTKVQKMAVEHQDRMVKIQADHQEHMTQHSADMQLALRELKQELLLELLKHGSEVERQHREEATKQ